MATISVAQLKSGEKIIEDVVTQRGKILFAKGKLINKREIDILNAFMIPSVSIEQKSEEAAALKEVKQEEKVEQENPLKTFIKEYTSMISLTKKMFTWIMSGSTLPILEIRTQLEALISVIDQYQPLTFNPGNIQSDDYLYHKSVKVSLTSYMLAKWHGLEQREWMPVALAGLFHDIGNAKVDPALLSKPTKLTSQEMDEIKKHTIYGYNILKPVASINDGVKLAALQHHEREDGSGYPMAVKGDKIHPYAKIIAISDIFHAATSTNNYKKSASPFLILEQIASHSFGKLEPAFVQTFINRAAPLHNGTVVKLSDGSIGEIVFTDRMNPTRPWVNANGKILNLTMDRALFIDQVIRG